MPIGFSLQQNNNEVVSRMGIVTQFLYPPQTGLIREMTENENGNSQTELIGEITENNQTELNSENEFKKEFILIKGLDNDLKILIYKIPGNLNKGLFESNISILIKNKILSFLREQEEGKLKDISEYEINEHEVENLIEIKEKFKLYKIKYDACKRKVYPGFGELYNLFEIFFNKLNIVYYDNESESESESGIY